MKFGIYFLGAFFALVALVGLYNHFLVEDESAEFLARARLDDRWLSIANKSAKEILDGTTYRNRYSINKSTESAAIGIFVFDSRISNMRILKYINSCGFYPTSKKIFCDVRFIDEFLRERDLDKEIEPFEGDRPIDTPFVLRETSKETYDELRLFMLNWILGHEIGHFVSGHGSSHFARNPMDARAEPRSVLQARELEADMFLASRFDPHSASGEKFYLALIHILNIEVKLKACPGVSPLQLCKNVQPGAGIFLPDLQLWFSTKESHPEYIIRIFRLIKACHEEYDIGGIGYLNDRIIEFLKEIE